MGVKSEVLFKILQKLQHIYKIPDKPSRKIPIVDQIVYFILKADETAAVAQAIYQNLVNDFVDWNEVRVTHPRDIQNIVAKYSAKNVVEKSNRLKEVLMYIFNTYNKLDLEFLWEKESAELQKTISQIPHLNQEFLYLLTATCLYENDNNISGTFLKIGKRLNLWDDSISSASLRKMLVKDLKELGVEGLMKLNILFHIHGETVCGVKTDCHRCHLFGDCEYAQKQGKKIETAPIVEKTVEAEKTVSGKKNPSVGHIEKIVPANPPASTPINKIVEESTPLEEKLPKKEPKASKKIGFTEKKPFVEEKIPTSPKIIKKIPVGIPLRSAVEKITIEKFVPTVKSVRSTKQAPTIEKSSIPEKTKKVENKVKKPSESGKSKASKNPTKPNKKATTNKKSKKK